MSLNASELELDIIASFKDEFADKWPDLRKYGEEEVRKFAESFVRIEELKLSCKIDEDQARKQLEIQKNSLRMVFLVLGGLGIMTAVESAINASLIMNKGVVNDAIGFALI